MLSSFISSRKEVERIRKLLSSENGSSLSFVLVMAFILLFAGLVAAEYARTLSRATADDRALAQARCAADTGIERVKVFLMADPQWSDGSVAEGPVDATSTVEKITIVLTTLPNGNRAAVVTSTGRCGKTRKTVRAVIEIGLVPLVSAYGGGIKQLKEGVGITVGGNSWVRSDVLVCGPLTIQGNGWIGTPSNKRTVYTDGVVNAGNKGTIFGDVYATSVIIGTVFGKQNPYWSPPVPFPDIGGVGALVDLARYVAQAQEQTTGEQHYFLGNKVFSASELAALDGVYFVEGTAYLPGGITNARASIVAVAGISVTGSLRAEGVTLMTAGNLALKNASNTSVALAVAGGDVGWKQTGGGNASFALKYGALVAGTVNGGDLSGSVILEQNDAVDFGTLSAPVHTTKIVSQTEM